MNNNQRDIRWANIPVGTGIQTIGQIGCLITVLSDILNTTPDIVNLRIRAVNGYANSNLVIWAKLAEAFPGIHVRRVWSYNNDDVKANTPRVLVESSAAPIGGRGSHWTNYIGNHQLQDPWTGLVRPTGDFPNPTGYAVITGTWNQNIGEDVLVNEIAAIVNGSADPHIKIVKIRSILQ